MLAAYIHTYIPRAVSTLTHHSGVLRGKKLLKRYVLLSLRRLLITLSE